MNLHEVTVPGERQAEERAWRAVASAYVATERAPSRRRRLGVRVVLAAATAVVASVALALSPPGDALAEWIARTVGARPAAAPAGAALSLPGPGRVLVATPRGLSLVSRDGHARPLGSWQDGALSPHGRFVAAVHGSTLSALDPAGKVRWTVKRPFPLAQPSWAPDGLAVAYRSGDGLRAVAGDGTNDRFLAGPMGPAAPVWLDARTIAYADRAGRVRTVDLIDGQAGWSSARVPGLRRLVAGGGSLVAVGASELRLLLFADGSTAGRRRARAGEAFVAAAGRGSQIALVSFNATSGLSRVEVSSLREALRGVSEAPSFPGRVGDPAFSPDGRRLLLAWTDADQWLFLPTHGPARVAAVTGLGRRLSGAGGTARVLGWGPAGS